MTLDEIKNEIARLSPHERAALRAWLARLEAAEGAHEGESETTAMRLGRLAGRAFAELRKRTREK
jgi:hypothetical protein